MTMATEAKAVFLLLFLKPALGAGVVLFRKRQWAGQDIGLWTRASAPPALFVLSCFLDMCVLPNAPFPFAVRAKSSSDINPEPEHIIH